LVEQEEEEEAASLQLQGSVSHVSQGMLMPESRESRGLGMVVVYAVLVLRVLGLWLGGCCMGMVFAVMCGSRVHSRNCSRERRFGCGCLIVLLVRECLREVGPPVGSGAVRCSVVWSRVLRLDLRLGFLEGSTGRVSAGGCPLTVVQDRARDCFMTLTRCVSKTSSICPVRKLR
jgi:hypothetical protein